MTKKTKEQIDINDIFYDGAHDDASRYREEVSQQRGGQVMNEVKEPEYVYVALYTHRNGENTRVFRTEASAWKWADSIARDKWDEWYSLDEPMPTEDIGKAYFGNMDTYYDGEFFEVGRCVIREDE